MYLNIKVYLKYLKYFKLRYKTSNMLIFCAILNKSRHRMRLNIKVYLKNLKLR